MIIRVCFLCITHTVHLWTFNMLGCRLCHSENYYYLFKFIDIYARHCIGSSLSLHSIHYCKNRFWFSRHLKMFKYNTTGEYAFYHTHKFIHTTHSHVQCTNLCFWLENFRKIDFPSEPTVSNLQTSNQIQFNVIHTRFVLQLMCLTVRKSAHFSCVSFYHWQISI